MMDALVGGKLHAKPEARTGKNGNTFATAKVRAAAGDGESLFVNVIAFDHAAVTALLALDAGDSIALSGSLTPKTWTDREGNARPALDLVAHAILSPYHVTRKRNAVQADRREADEGQRLDAWEPGALDF
ncbi:MAG TPA: single-stranded DNA-binding protein [Giesbergeria sp.]|nr:single-stranded DNA-binding protein [Giesbergeria sp.]